MKRNRNDDNKVQEIVNVLVMQSRTERQRRGNTASMRLWGMIAAVEGSAIDEFATLASEIGEAGGYGGLVAIIRIAHQQKQRYYLDLKTNGSYSSDTMLKKV